MTDFVKNPSITLMKQHKRLLVKTRRKNKKTRSEIEHIKRDNEEQEIIEGGMKWKLWLMANGSEHASAARCQTMYEIHGKAPVVKEELENEEQIRCLEDERLVGL